MIELTPHVRLSPEDILTIHNPSILHDSCYEDTYVENLIAEAPSAAKPFLRHVDNPLSMRVDIGAWREQDRFDPDIDSEILLYAVESMLQFRKDDGDTFISINYRHGKHRVQNGNFAGYIHPTAEYAIKERFPIGERAIRRISRSMMLAFDTSDGNEHIDKMSGSGNYSFGEIAGRLQESVWCDNSVRIYRQTKRKDTPIVRDER